MRAIRGTRLMLVIIRAAFLGGGRRFLCQVCICMWQHPLLPPGLLCSPGEASAAFPGQVRWEQRREGRSMAGTVTIMQAVLHSVSLPHTHACTHAADFSYGLNPCSLTGSSLSTPMGSGVRSSVPSSVKPAVSSVTYFSHSAATLEQCLAPILV